MSKPKTSAKSAKPSKTKFVLSLPYAMSVGEVVSKAKEAGLVISEGYVSNIRSNAKSKKRKSAGGKKGKAKRAAATTKTTVVAPSTERGRGGSKSAFVRSQPRHLKAAEVVKAAKKSGLKISLDYVYKVRSRTPATKAPAAARGPGLATARSSSRGGDAEFKRLVIELGVPRAETLVAEVRRRLEEVIRGL